MDEKITSDRGEWLTLVCQCEQTLFERGTVSEAESARSLLSAITPYGPDWNKRYTAWSMATEFTVPKRS